MSTKVIPKITINEKTNTQVPVWEITPKGSSPIYYERIHRPGYIPIGNLGTSCIGETMLTIYKPVNPTRNNPIKILCESDGHIAPFSWYRDITKPNIKRTIKCEPCEYRRKIRMPKFKQEETCSNDTSSYGDSEESYDDYDDFPYIIPDYEDRAENEPHYQYY